MAQIFPKWTNNIQTYIASGAVFIAVAVVSFFWYYGSPWYTVVGYRPVQPVPYSHKLHAGDLGLDCRYCHNLAEKSASANVPPTQTCMNCHSIILTESEKLLPVRESWGTKKPIEWVRVHKVADYCYFNHSAHLYAGVGCADCHGNIAEMEVVMQVKPLSMGWCLECHRNPEMHLRPHVELTNMYWVPPDKEEQMKFAEQVIKEKAIAPPQDCSGCHR
ncbi:MAG: cytochrome C [candidate division Zixibacteria bacterium HGW-Zixibacteria-1]|nr:MAG: cytochrome C [candidate division Zixibacteria bacterium HGW-Zixibacteria-1]